jgi:hypothetical protein
MRWNADREAVEFSVIVRPYEETVRIGRRVFQRLLDQSPTPDRCMEAFHLQRTRFELVVERKLRRRQLTDDGNVKITGRDLREKPDAGGRLEPFDVAFVGAAKPEAAPLSPTAKVTLGCLRLVQIPIGCSSGNL